MDAGVLSIGAATIAAGGAIAQAIWRAGDERQREEEKAKREAAEADREAISRRLGALESRAAGHDLADARHDQAIEHQSELLAQIRDELREMNRVLLGQGGRR